MKEARCESWRSSALGNVSSCLLYRQERFALRYHKSCMQDHGGDLQMALVREDQ